jgi:hypothetical protein
MTVTTATNITGIRRANISFYYVYPLHFSVLKDHQMILLNIYMPLLNC